MNTWQEWQDSGELEGYEATFGTLIDREHAENTPCPKCGGKCSFMALDNYRGSYRCFKVCDACDNSTEF
jgi:hypothetical protein